MLERTILIPKGTEVTIPKGTPIWGTFKEGHKVAGRTYKVKIHDPVIQYGDGQIEFVKVDGGYEKRPFRQYITWAGAGGYWHHVYLDQLGIEDGVISCGR